MTKLNRACPASPSVDRRNCHEFGSVERFFNFFIPINLIHTFMITDELHSEQTLLVAPEHRRYCMSALPPKADMCSAVAHVRFWPKADISTDQDGLGAASISTSVCVASHAGHS